MTIDTFLNRKRVRRAWSVLGVLLVSSFTIFWGFSVFATDLETFDNYQDGDLVGQYGWTSYYEGQWWDIQNTYFVGSSGKAPHFDCSVGCNTNKSSCVEKTLDVGATTSFDFSMRLGFSGGTQWLYLDAYDNTFASVPFRIKANWHYQVSEVDFSYGDSMGTTNFATGGLANTWYTIRVQFNVATDQCNFSVDDLGSSGWVACPHSINLSVKRLVFCGYLYQASATFDQPPPKPFRIWGVSPASSTEILQASTEFTFGYEGFASTTWSGILVNFCEEITGICANEKKYPKADLSGTSGEKTLTFEDFDFDANGHWNLIGDAYFGSFNANWEWVEGFTGDVVSPEYFVIINLEGLPTIFEVEEPETWYSENTEYATSTAFFSGISDLLTPFFNKVGEFGSRVNTFFNQDEAYSRGYNIGGVLPLFKLYIDQFSFLFGGFPLISTFILAMVLTMGFFLFKLVLKVVRG